MKKPHYDLTQGAIGWHVRRLAMAMGWGIVAMNIVHFTNMWFISRLGHDHLAAIAFTMPVTVFSFFMILAMSSGMTSAVARAAGSNRGEHTARTVTAGIAGALIMGAVLMACAYALKNHVFLAMGAPADMLPLINSFMNVWLLCIPFMVLTVVTNAAARGYGEARLPALVMIQLAITNLILDPIFIFGLDMGMQGAATATLCAYGLATISALYIAATKLHLLRPKTLRNIPKTKRALKTWWNVTGPVSIAYSIEPLSNGILTASVASLGLGAVAAYGVVTRVEGLAMIVLMAMWGAVTPLAGQNWAAGKHERVRHTIEVASLINGVFCILFACLMWFCAHRVASLFSSDADTVRLAALYLSIVPVSYVGFGASGLIGSALNGIGRARWYLVANSARVLTLLAMAVYGAHHFGFYGFALGVGASNLLCGFVIAVWSRRVFLASKPV